MKITRLFLLIICANLLFSCEKDSDVSDFLPEGFVEEQLSIQNEENPDTDPTAPEPITIGRVNGEPFEATTSAIQQRTQADGSTLLTMNFRNAEGDELLFSVFEPQDQQTYTVDQNFIFIITYNDASTNIEYTTSRAITSFSTGSLFLRYSVNEILNQGNVEAAYQATAFIIPTPGVNANQFVDIQSTENAFIDNLPVVVVSTN